MIVAYHITNEGIVTSAGDVITEPPFIGFLLNSYPDAIKVFYDVDASVASLCKLIEMTEQEATEFHETEKFRTPPYKLTYFPNIMFIIDKDSLTATFYNMNQDGYLDAEYNDDNSLNSALFKAQTALNVADKVISIYHSLGLKNVISSPIKAFLDKYPLDFLPTVDDYPEDVAKLAYESTTGTMQQIYKMGYWNKVYDYDINGSYGYELYNMPDIRKGTWVKDKYPPDNAMLGWVNGLFNTDCHFHPFARQTGGGNFYTTGEQPKIFTLNEYLLMQRWELGSFKPYFGYWWIPNKIAYPYRGIIQWLWDKRQGTVGNEKTIIQRIYAGLYGMTLQSARDSFGDMFNPVVGATVEANTRIQVCDTCLQNNIVPLAIIVDGFISDKELPIKLSNELGRWKLSHTGKCIIAGTQTIAIENKGNNFNWLIEQIKAKPRASTYSIEKYSPVTLSKALADDFSKLGEIEKEEWPVSIGQDTRRMYFERPKNGEELISSKIYESLPWSNSNLLVS